MPNPKVIDIEHLLRTGNLLYKTFVTYSEFIVTGAEWYRESDERLGQAYYNVLSVIRPDIAKEVCGANCDPFYDNNLLPDFFAAVYKRW